VPQFVAVYGHVSARQLLGRLLVGMPVNDTPSFGLNDEK
jgi:hypothetical protein